MTRQPDAEVVRAFLGRTARRVTLLLVMHGITTGIVVAVTINMIAWFSRGSYLPPGPELSLLVLLAAVIGMARGLMLRPRAALIVEAQAPACRNLLVTASELIAGPGRTDPYVAALVHRNAAELIRSLQFNRLFPLRGAIASVLLSGAIWTFAMTRSGAAPGAATAHATTALTATAITGVDVSVVLPAYVGQTQPVLHDPARVEAFVGSTIRLTVRASAATVAIETLHGKALLHAAGNNTFTGDVPADADGFIAIEPANDAGLAGSRRLIGVSVVPDQPPRVRVSTPGRDLRFNDGRHTIDLAIDADDDLGLASLRLRYTKVSGSGERFTFADGDVPLAITRTDKRAWQARASWRLDTLGLGPGDMVVYRAVASDNRPGAPETESDSYIVEILAPGGIAAAGFANDPEVERYALSEQMVILKTEQLATRRAAMTADSLANAAAEIAMEQRRVRAEFVFMMGGEVGGVDDPTGNLNEEAEASAEGDLAVARMLNQGRAALLNAIRLMSRADKALSAPDLSLALTHERAALVELERTFAHSHIILRALTERERLDLTRRLSGSLTGAVSDAEPAIRPDEDQRLLALRNALSGIAALANVRQPGDTVAAHAVGIAENVLRIDPSSKPGQQVAAQLDSAATALRGLHRDAARALFDRAATGVSRLLRASLLAAPPAAPGENAARLAGALADALRRRP